MVNLEDSNFAEFISTAKLPVIVDCWASWCGPCKAMLPILESFATKYKDKYIIAKVNIDENPNISNHLNITSIPTLLFFKNNKIVGTAVGMIPEPKILQYCSQYFGNS